MPDSGMPNDLMKEDFDDWCDLKREQADQKTIKNLQSKVKELEELNKRYGEALEKIGNEEHLEGCDLSSLHPPDCYCSVEIAKQALGEKGVSDE